MKMIFAAITAQSGRGGLRLMALAACMSLPAAGLAYDTTFCLKDPAFIHVGVDREIRSQWYKGLLDADAVETSTIESVFVFPFPYQQLTGWGWVHKRRFEIQGARKAVEIAIEEENGVIYTNPKIKIIAAEQCRIWHDRRSDPYLAFYSPNARGQLLVYDGKDSLGFDYFSVRAADYEQGFQEGRAIHRRSAGCPE